MTFDEMVQREYETYLKTNPQPSDSDLLEGIARALELMVSFGMTPTSWRERLSRLAALAKLTAESRLLCEIPAEPLFEPPIFPGDI